TMAKLVVEVVEANDLMPKDGNGSSNPFVEVEFGGQRQRTSTRHKSLNPRWNEKLVFGVRNPEELSSRTIEAFVYNDNRQGFHRNFLGKVRMSGMTAYVSQHDASLQRYPLEKRGIFSHVRGDIALKVYVLNGRNGDFRPSRQRKTTPSKKRTFYSLGSEVVSTVTETMSLPGEEKAAEEYGVVETRPPLAARLGFWGRDKTASTYDMVEQMNFLFVRVVKAEDLPAMDASGSLDPYVEVKVGNYKGVTPHFEKSRNPVWNRTFAFSKERLQSSVIEITVKDRDVSKDDFVGKVVFDVPDVPERVPPDSPLAPQWYKLLDKRGELLKRGDIMLAVWMGTQADEAFPDAWHSDALGVNQESVGTTRSKVYFSPRLYYLRVQVIRAQDLVPADPSQPADAVVRVELGGQGRCTGPSSVKGSNPVWDEELMYVAWEPFDEYVVVSVEDRDIVVGRVLIPVRNVPQRVETTKPTDALWYGLQKPSFVEEEGGEKKDKFASRVLLRLSIDSGYHVFDEPTQFSSDLRPSAGQLRKPSIGILEVGILGAKNLLPMKAKEGKVTDAYCVAKYGNKWVRTRTLLNDLNPLWNEQYTWEVYDPYTVITVGVFDNGRVDGGGGKDRKVGKVRIRISTLETDRVYTHAYSLLVMGPAGLKKNGELHLAVRFTCTAWPVMLSQYMKPLLPKMNYNMPISIKHVDLLRHLAMGVVAGKLARAEPPLAGEVVEYMMDVDYHMFSMRRSKANFFRVMGLVSGIHSVGIWLYGVSRWENPVTTVLIHVLFLVLVSWPELILPTFFLYLFAIGLWNYPARVRVPPHMDARLSQAEEADPDELDEEFDTFPTSGEMDLVRMRYDRLRSVAGRVQSVAADLATQEERAVALLSWRDPRATAIFVAFSIAAAVLLYVAPFRMVVLVAGLYLLRHPRLRRKLPPIPVNFFKRLPARSDVLL
ncbi:hypothetical protein M569_08887, partial [Genlisea aurea]